MRNRRLGIQIESLSECVYMEGSVNIHSSAHTPCMTASSDDPAQDNCLTTGALGLRAETALSILCKANCNLQLQNCCPLLPAAVAMLQNCGTSYVAIAAACSGNCICIAEPVQHGKSSKAGHTSTCRQLLQKVLACAPSCCVSNMYNSESNAAIQPCVRHIEHATAS